MWPLVRCFVRRRSGVSDGHFLVRLSGPFPGADLPLRAGAARRGGQGWPRLGEATASRREASLTAPSTAPG